MSTPIDFILGQRGRTYGNFLTQSHIAAEIKEAMRRHTRGGWDEELAPDQREALEMFAVKIARIINGDPNYADNWRDIEGYARLVANRLEEKL